MHKTCLNFPLVPPPELLGVYLLDLQQDGQVVEPTLYRSRLPLLAAALPPDARIDGLLEKREKLG